MCRKKLERKPPFNVGVWKLYGAAVMGQAQKKPPVRWLDALTAWRNKKTAIPVGSGLQIKTAAVFGRVSQLYK